MKKLVKNNVFWLFVVVVCTAIVYYKSIFFEFVSFDDGLYVFNNFRVINFTKSSVVYFFTNYVFGHYFPLTMLTYGIQSAVWGINPLAFHAFNLLLHIANILALYVVLKKLRVSNIGLLIAIALFALHPIQVESVAWIGTRGGILSTIFSLLSIYFYIGYCEKNKPLGAMFWVTIFFVLAVFSKSSAILLTPLYLIIDVFYKRKKSILLLIEKSHLFFLSFVFGVVSIIAARELGTVSTHGFSGGSEVLGINRIFEVLYAWAFYLNTTLWPSGLTAMHYNPTVVNGLLPVYYYVSFLIPVAVFGIVIFNKVTRSWGVLALGWYTLLLITVINIVPLGGTIVSERYAYFAGIGGFLALGIGLNTAFNYYNLKKFFPLFYTTLLIVLAILSWQRLNVWQNTFELFSDIYNKAPNHAHAQNGFANELAKKGNYTEALQLHNKAVNATPNAKHYGDRAGVKYMVDSLQQALNDFTMAIQLKPTDGEYYTKRAFVRQKLGNLEGTLTDLDIAINLDPLNAIARQLRAETRFFLGDKGGACTDWLYLFQKGDAAMEKYLNNYCLKTQETNKTFLDKVTYPNGVTQMEVITKNINDNTQQWLVTYDTLGRKIEEGIIMNGKYNGQVFWYYPSGKILRKGYYKDVLPYGNWEEFYEDGTKMATYTYLTGVKHGVYEYFYPNGDLWTQKIYENGKLMEVPILKSPTGKHLQVGTLQQGNGILNVYDETGKRQFEVTYKNGKLEKTKKISEN